MQSMERFNEVKTVYPQNSVQQRKILLAKRTVSKGEKIFLEEKWLLVQVAHNRECYSKLQKHEKKGNRSSYGDGKAIMP